MGYRVDYQPIRKVRGVEKRTLSVPALTALCMLLFVLIVNIAWPRGKAVLNKLLFPGNAAVTVAALEDFTVELKSGEELSGAFETFCRRVIREAEFDSN